ncbi:MAG: hypothetical protein ACI4M4_08630 [Candidatus Ornithospirochaeta sp.]
MKKTFAIVALLVMVVSVVSAGSVYLDSGVSLLSGSRAYKNEGSSDTKTKYANTYIPLEIGYREAFDNGVVVSGSAEVFFNLKETIGGETFDEKSFPTVFSFKAQAGYGMKINEKLAAEFLGGLSYSFGSNTKESSGVKVKLSQSTIILVGEAGIKYEIADSITLRAGAKIGIPFTSSMKVNFTMGSNSDTQKSKLSGFMINITPFVGAAYQF